MSTNKKLIVVLVGVLVIALVGSVYTSITEHKKVRQYEPYIFSKLNQNTAKFVTSILLNEELLSKYDENSTAISSEDISNLCFQYKDINESYEELYRLSVRLVDKSDVKITTAMGKYGESTHLSIAIAMLGNEFYGDCSTDKDLILDDTNKEEFTRLKEINREMATIVKNIYPSATSQTISFSNKQAKNNLSAMLEQMTLYANELQL